MLWVLENQFFFLNQVPELVKGDISCFFFCKALLHMIEILTSCEVLQSHWEKYEERWVEQMLLQRRNKRCFAYTVHSHSVVYGKNFTPMNILKWFSTNYFKSLVFCGITILRIVFVVMGAVRNDEVCPLSLSLSFSCSLSLSLLYYLMLCLWKYISFQSHMSMEIVFGKASQVFLWVIS